MKSDARVPSTFRQPDDPDWKELDITFPNAANTEVRFALRGFSRKEKDYAASCILSIILRERFLKMLGGNHFEKASVLNKAYALPGYVALGYSSKDPIVPLPLSHQAAPDAPDYVRNNPILALFWNITEAEFAKAFPEFIAENAKRSRDDRWLDIDTYKIVLADEAKAFENVTLADVQGVADRLAKKPVVTVTVSNGKR